MKIIERFKDWRLRSLENKLIKIHRRNNLSFNPLQVGLTVNLMSDKTYSARLLENFVWYSASIPLLRNFYYKNGITQNVFGNDDSNFFWRKAPEKIRKVHSKLPAIITDRMVDLITGSGITFEFEIYNEDNSINEEETEKAQRIIKEIYKENKIQSLISNAVSAESWGGGVAFKICFDSDLSKLPILEVEDARNFELVTKRNRTVAIIFKRWYEKGSKQKPIKYLLHETYTTNEYGKAMITNELFKIESDKLKPVELTAIEETAEYKPKEVFETVNGMLAFYKPNRFPNKEFLGTPYGESDYAGCYSLFDSADEILSTALEETRKNKTKYFIPNSLIPKNIHGQDLEFNDFEYNYVKIDDKDDINQNEIITHSPDLKVKQYIEEWKEVLITILNSVGLSPLTIGVTGLESINASENSQKEREKVSLRTRNNKIKLWTEFLENLTFKVLAAYREMRSRGIIHPGLSDVLIDESNCSAKVSFGDYISTSFEERLSTYGDALLKGSISIEEMVEQIYRDTKTEEQKKNEIDRIKMEKGMSLSNLDNLLL